MCQITDNDILKQYGGKITNDLNNILGTYEDAENEPDLFQHSHYYDWEGLQNVLVTKKDYFKILSLNCQSIQAKFDKIMTLLDYLNTKECQLSALCLQETWLTNDDDTSPLNIPGYHLISKGKQVSGHGGLLVYLHDSFTYTVKNIKITSTRWEGQFIDIKHNRLKHKIILGNIYRPPRRNNCNNELNSFLDEFRPILETILEEKCITILAGDLSLKYAN